MLILPKYTLGGINLKKQKINPYIMFKGQAEEAINHYISVFGNGEILFVQRYGDAKDHVETTISEEDANKFIHASFTLAGQFFFCADQVGGDQQFPAGGTISLAISCDSDDEIERLYKGLGDSAEIMMPLQQTFWGAKYALFVDKYGITWHLNYQEDK